uniref:Uncharacterized protein n=1 Tax=Rhizophora mucronata TaxID=61149 RepID=A0A2P2PE95_RHIMU
MIRRFKNTISHEIPQKDMRILNLYQHIKKTSQEGKSIR